jgi:hypothetical protein
MLTKRKTIYLKKFLLVVVSAFILNSCSGQARDTDSCKQNYIRARSKLNSYYKNSKRSLLIASLNYVDESVKCSATRLASVELKISLLTLLRRYKAGYDYVDSLSEADFKYPYKKKMFYYYLRSLNYKNNFDVNNANRMLSQAGSGIQVYIDEKNLAKSQDLQEAYYDLFFIRQKLVGSKQTAAEIDVAKKQHPELITFLDQLKRTIVGKPLSAYGGL